MNVSGERERVYWVQGMTCTHCTEAVAGEVEALPGVTAVDVDLESGRLAVRGQRIDHDAVASAVSEAGYEVRV